MTAAPLRAARVRVPCSTSNLGAGFDCIGLALDRHLEAAFEPGGARLEIVRGGTLANLPSATDEDLTAHCFTRAARAAGAEPAGVLRMVSTIPVARGLGSSAAATVAGLVLGRLAAGHLQPVAFEGRAAGGGALPDALAALLEDAAMVEGHPDNVAPALAGGLVAVVPSGAGPDRPRWTATRLALSPSLGFAFAAPAVEVATTRARAVLPESVPHAAAARSLARVLALVHGFGTGDAGALRAGFDDELHVPFRLPLIPGAAAAFEAARAAGAWAATISGSGSGLLAVCAAGAERAIADAMKSALGGDAAGALGFAVRPDREGLLVLEAEA